MKKRKKVGFVSTRFGGTDGVSMEASKWGEVFEEMGHDCFWFAGELDRLAEKSFLVPEAHFQYELNEKINEKIFGKKWRKLSTTDEIHNLRLLLKNQLYEFIKRFEIDFLIVENALALPLHVPFGLALTETIAETQIPTICHHHDFYWERSRFSVNSIKDYLHMAFPPNLPNIKHVVINSDAQEQLAHRTGISSVIIPNVLDFENPPNSNINGAQSFRDILCLKSNDRMILQPTRIIQRKGIEYAIELVKELKDSCNKLVISHEAGDEGFEYVDWLKEYALEHGVDLKIISANIDPLNNHNGGKHSLWDIYPHADFITYPSIREGFGNAFLEAIYFKKPLLVNRYDTFIRDIECKGFEVIKMDNFLTKKTTQNVKEILNNPLMRERMVNHNYEIAKKHYSYKMLRKHFNRIIEDLFGDDLKQEIENINLTQVLKTPMVSLTHESEDRFS